MGFAECLGHSASSRNPVVKEMKLVTLRVKLEFSLLINNSLFLNGWWKQTLPRIFIRRRELTQFIRKTGSENHTTVVDRPHN
jgi:hypothetical protein